MEHRNITGLDALHPHAIRQASDPGAIGADKGWLDTSVTPPRYRIRNAANTGWDDPQPGVTLPLNRTSDTLQRVLTRNMDFNPRDYQANQTDDIGDGALDAGAAIATAEANAPANAAIRHRPGTYLHTVNRNYTRYHRPDPGAILKPNVGININFAAPIVAGEWQVMDLSLGTVSFNNSPQREFWGAWFGIGQSNGANDDQAILEKLDNVLPDGSIVHLSGTLHRINKTWKPAYGGAGGKTSIQYVGAASPFPDQKNTTRFIWGGAEKPITFNDGAMAAGSNHLTSASNPFTAAMVGRTVWVPKCKATQPERHKNWLRAQITAYNAPNDVTLNFVNGSGLPQAGLQVTVDGPEMIFLRSTNGCTLKWIVCLPAYLTDGAGGGTYTNRSFRVDISGEGNTGSNNTLIECKSYLDHALPLPAFPYCVGFSVGDWSNGNQEFNRFIRCQANGAPVERKTGLATITDVGAGKKRVTFSYNMAGGGLAVAGTRIRIGDAMGAGLPIDTTLANHIADNTIDITDAAVVAVVNANATVGEAKGIGFLQGQSADLHRTQFIDCLSQGNETGLWANNGSGHIEEFTGNGDECDIEITTGSLPWRVVGTRGENSGQFLYYAAGAPLFLVTGSPSALTCAPNVNFIELVGGAPVEYLANSSDVPPIGSKLFGSAGYTGHFNESGNVWGGATAAQIGLQDFTSPVNENTSEPTTRMRRNERSHFHYNTTVSGLSEAMLVELEVNGSSATRTSGIRGHANPHATDASKEFAGVIGSAGRSFAPFINTQALWGFIAEQPTGPYVPGGGGPKASVMGGLRVTSPNITTPGGTNLATGLQIDAQAGAGVDNSHGIFQLGASDLNKLLGRTVRATPSSAPADSDIDPGCSSDWTDEAGNTRKSRVRYSGGTYKTETGPGLV